MTHTPCKECVQACIDALPREAGAGPYEPFAVLEGMRQARTSLKAILPAPDPVIVEEPYCGNCRWYTNAGSCGPCKRYAPRNCRDEHPEYAKWPWVSYHDLCGEYETIQSGKIEGKG